MTVPLSGLALLALLWAAIEDLLYRKIENWLVAMLALLWLAGLGLGILRDGAESLDILAQAAWALPGALAVLVVGFVLFRLGKVGAGDAKLMAVLCLWVGAPQQPAFLIVTSLAGGLLVLLMPVLTVLETVAAHLWWSLTRRVPGLTGMTPPHSLSSQPVAGVPYALAITAGAALTLNVPVNP
jgi:Flp pilus assembly protein, protease CpaA